MVSGFFCPTSFINVEPHVSLMVIRQPPVGINDCYQRGREGIPERAERLSELAERAERASEPTGRLLGEEEI